MFSEIFFIPEKSESSIITDGNRKVTDNVIRRFQEEKKMGKTKNNGDNRNSVVAFGPWGWFHIIYMLLMFWFYVGMINDGSNNVADSIAERMLGSADLAGTISTCNSIAGILGVLIFILVGVINRKIGARFTSGINCIIAGFTYIGVFNAPNLVFYTIMMALTCGMIMSAGYLCGGVIVANWFPKKKGIVMGYTTMGHNLATAAFVPLILFLVGRFGVANACYPIAVACIALGIVGLIFVRDTPFARGYYPDNVNETIYNQYYDTGSEEDESEKDGGWMVGKLLKCDQTWAAAVTTGIFQICSVGTMSQMINRTTNGFGFSTTTAATIMSVCAVVGVAGSFLIGVLDQKIGTKRAMIVFGIWYATALVFNFTNTMVGFWVSIVMIGIGIGGSANFTTSLPTSIFGRQGYDRVNSVLFPIQGIITALTFAINGAVMNMTGGNVRYAYAIDACLALINVVLIIVFVKDHKYNRDWLAEQEANERSIDKPKEIAA